MSIFVSSAGDVRVGGKKGKGDMVFRYMSNEGEENDSLRKQRYVDFIRDRNNEVRQAVRTLNASKEEGEDYPLLLFKWNDAGLQARIATAAATGLRNSAGALVATVDDMKDAIATFLSTAPDAGTDLGGHHDLFQFLPSYRYDRKMTTLIQAHTYLRRRGQGFPTAPADAVHWPDIVDYCQTVSITRANVAIGPHDVTHFFNI